MREIWETGAHDLLVVEAAGGERVLLSTARQLMPEVDLQAKRIVVKLLPGMLEPLPEASRSRGRSAGGRGVGGQGAR